MLTHRRNYLFSEFRFPPPKLVLLAISNVIENNRLISACDVRRLKGFYYVF